MRFDYSRPRSTADRLLSRFGKTAVLEKPGEPSGPAWDPVPGEPTQHEITVLEFNERVRDRSGTLIGQSVTTLYVSTSAGVAPEKADRVQVDGSWYEIDEARRLAPGPTVLMWEVDLVHG